MALRRQLAQNCNAIPVLGGQLVTVATMPLSRCHLSSPGRCCCGAAASRNEVGKRRRHKIHDAVPGAPLHPHCQAPLRELSDGSHWR